jgi:recombination protein U
MAKKSQRVGQQLENMIDSTNANYLLKGLALMVRQHEEVKTKGYRDKDTKQKVITSAYHKGKGGLDYAGVVNGRYVSFDAKSAADRLAFSAITSHQVRLMKNIERMGGDAFILTYIRSANAVYLVPAAYLVPLYEEWEAHQELNKATGKNTRYEGGASLNVTNLNDNAFVVLPSLIGSVDWLPAYNKMIQARMAGV